MRRALWVTGLLWAGWARAEAVCPHPYFPIEEGLDLTYQVGKSEVPIRIRQVEPIPQGQRGTLEMSLDGRHGQTEARCSEVGITTGSGGLEGLALNSSGMAVKVLSAEGVLLPPEAELVPGKHWKHQITFQLRPPEGSRPKGILGGTLVLTTTLSQESEVVGSEKVKTPAGTFRALKIRMRTVAGSGARGSDRTMEGTLWLAPKVGVVKWQNGNHAPFQLIRIQRNQTARNDLGKKEPPAAATP